MQLQPPKIIVGSMSVNRVIYPWVPYICSVFNNVELVLCEPNDVHLFCWGPHLWKH